MNLMTFMDIDLEIQDNKVTGKLESPIIDAKAKAKWVKEKIRALDLKTENCAAIGDGANDIKMMQEVFLSWIKSQRSSKKYLHGNQQQANADFFYGCSLHNKL